VPENRGLQRGNANGLHLKFFPAALQLKQIGLQGFYFTGHFGRLLAEFRKPVFFLIQFAFSTAGKKKCDSGQRAGYIPENE
jgi:hypothetical protein